MIDTFETVARGAMDGGGLSSQPEPAVGGQLGAAAMTFVASQPRDDPRLTRVS